VFPPALGTIGNARLGLLCGSGFQDVDLSVSKNWKFTERRNAQFRAEFFNVLNHPNFFGIASIGKAGDLFEYPTDANFGCSCITPDQTGDYVSGSGGTRSIELGLRLTFQLDGPTGGTSKSCCEGTCKNRSHFAWVSVRSGPDHGSNNK
jgi:hypothetical protein